jgi:hypothetical protein
VDLAIKELLLPALARGGEPAPVPGVLGAEVATVCRSGSDVSPLSTEKGAAVMGMPPITAPVRTPLPTTIEHQDRRRPRLCADILA